MRTLIMSLTMVVAFAHAAIAEMFLPTTLDPIVHRSASLTIVKHDGTEVSYSPAQLEEFETYSLTTTTPWRSEPAMFEGVMLSDVLAVNGLTGASVLRVTAENDYATNITKAVLDDVNIMLATRVNGRAHTARERGPIQFIIAAEEFTQSPVASESNFVWMAARIETVD